MEEFVKDKVRTKTLRKLIFLVAFTGIMLISATYAWFSTQKNVTLANLQGKVKVAEGLQISLDAKNWSNSIDFSDFADPNDLKRLYGTTDHNIIPTEMLPASTTANENLDGSGYTSSGIRELSFYRGTNINGANLYGIQKVSSDIAKIDAQTGEEGIDKITATGSPDVYPGYYAIDFFLENSSESNVGFDVLQLNSDSSVTIKSDGNTTVGLQNTPRVAFALYNSDTTSGGSVEVGAQATTQETILTATTGEKSTIKDVAIWEPNADTHVEYIVTNNNKVTFSGTDQTGYSIPATNKFTGTQRIPTYALNSKSLTLATDAITQDGTGVGTPIGTGYSDIYKWDGTYTGKGIEKQITLQTDTGNAVVQNLVSVTSGEDTVTPDGTGATTFQIPKGQVCRIRMYIWLEGQDVDCINYASHGGGIEVDVGLIKGATEGEQGTGGTDVEYVSVNEIFDATGNDPDKLHIGDFVNYDAGTWTQEEINAIQTGKIGSLQTANGSTSLPSNAFQFGGFTAGSSRNGNATPYSNDYVKDASTGQAITGWRLFDIEEDGTVVLISAGNIEDYYKQFSPVDTTYIDEYILTGNINSNWNNGATASSNYQKRNWNIYASGTQGKSATVLSYSMLKSWYGKYIEEGDIYGFDNAIFQKIYQDPYIKYQNVIDNNSIYWFSEAYDDLNMYLLFSDNRGIINGNDYAYGVRAVVSLKSEVKFKETKTGMKTLTSDTMTEYGGNQTYNVWDIQ